MTRHIRVILLFTLFSCSLAAQEELVLPYDATSLTDEQRALNPTYLAYPTSIAEQMPLQICGTDYTPMPFTINENGDQVYFSPGNLQYNAALGSHLCADGTTQPGTWRFAEHQYDYVGDATNGNVMEGGVKCDNSKVSSSYSGWIDLFGWGTSGWNSGANAYLPWSTSTTYSDYYPGGSASNNLTGAYANADWGIYNQIGDDPAGTWRTLTKDEWVYLFYGRANAATLFCLGSVAGVNGTILLPDGWSLPAGVTFTPSTTVGLEDQGTLYYNSSGTHYSDNTYTAEQWKDIMEPSGAVFLPASGYRHGTAVDDAGQYGDYWSSTQDDASYAYGLSFDQYRLDLQYYGRRYFGQSVRLVQDVPKHPFSVAEDRRVIFSPGNLQYNAALGEHLCADGTTQSGTWRFAENQWDFVGDATQGNVYWNDVKCDNSLISETYDGWIDLFGWGTSGWNSGAVCYQPWSTSTTYSDYYPGGNYSNNLMGDYTNADWGVYNQIGNDLVGTWRTLTYDEWDYILKKRTYADKLCGQATVNGVHGLILLPDNWTVPTGITFSGGYRVGYDKNIYTLQYWKELMEPAGAVFFPASYHRIGTGVDSVLPYGYLWSATATSSTSAGTLNFEMSNAYPYGNFRNLGYSVRLVRDEE